MPNEQNSTNQEANSSKQQTNAQDKNIVHRVEGLPQQQNPQGAQGTSNRHPKPSFPVRILRVLWRRRTWRRIRNKEDGGGPHWAEKSVVVLTLGILIGTLIQAHIYSKQAGIMVDSLKQNERSIMLGSGQLIVATRNAATAEATLKSSEKSFAIEHRPYVVMDEGFPGFFQHMPVADQPVQANIQLRNIGATPADHVLISLDSFIVTGKPVAGLTRKEIEEAREGYIKMLESKFKTLRSSNETVRKETEGLEKRNLSPGQDLAPKTARLITTKELVVSQDAFPKLTTGVVQIYVITVVNYGDASGNTYSTETCNSFWGGPTSAWHVCDSHNQIR